MSPDATENVVTSTSSSESVVGSTFTMSPVGVGRGRGAFVVSTKDIVVSITGVVDDGRWVVGFLLVVAFLRDVIVVLRFTVTFAGATGFLDVFITVDVELFVGFCVAIGRLVGFTVISPSDATDVRLNACDETGFLVELVGFFVRCASVVGCFVVTSTKVDDGGGAAVTFCLESCTDWNVASLIPSVVLASSLKLIDVETFLWMIVPRVVVKPPTFTVYRSVVLAGGRLDVGISSKVLLL